MGIRGPEFHGTACVESNIAWHKRMGLYIPDMADSVTFEASLYDCNRKTLRSMKPWRNSGSKEWIILQDDKRTSAFCGGQSL